MKVMAVCDFILAALCGQPFANNFSIGCAYLLAVLAFVNLGMDNLRES